MTRQLLTASSAGPGSSSQDPHRQQQDPATLPELTSLAGQLDMKEDEENEAECGDLSDWLAAASRAAQWQRTHTQTERLSYTQAHREGIERRLKWALVGRAVRVQARRQANTCRRLALFGPKDMPEKWWWFLLLVVE